MPNYNDYKEYKYYYVSSGKHNDSVDLQNSNAVGSAPGLLRKRNTAGQTIGVTHQDRRNLNVFSLGAYVAPLHPYQGVDASSGSTFIVNIQYGTHGGIPPTISGGSPLVENLLLNTFTIDSGTQIVYVKSTLVSGSITAAEIDKASTGTPPTDSIDMAANGTSYQTIFATSCSLYSGSIARVACASNVLGSQYVLVCGTIANYNGV